MARNTMLQYFVWLFGSFCKATGCGFAGGFIPEIRFLDDYEYPEELAFMFASIVERYNFGLTTPRELVLRKFPCSISLLALLSGYFVT